MKCHGDKSPDELSVLVWRDLAEFDVARADLLPVQFECSIRFSSTFEEDKCVTGSSAIPSTKLQRRLDWVVWLEEVEHFAARAAVRQSDHFENTFVFKIAAFTST